MKTIKCLSVKQPWADLFVFPEKKFRKTIEVRTWPTHYTGDLIITASKKRDMEAIDWLCEKYGFLRQAFLCQPVGVAICRVRLVECTPMLERDERAAMCPYAPGLWSWVLSDPVPLEPVPIRGQLRLFEIDDVIPDLVQ